MTVTAGSNAHAEGAKPNANAYANTGSVPSPSGGARNSSHAARYPSDTTCNAACATPPKPPALLRHHLQRQLLLLPPPATPPATRRRPSNSK
jgi:hypothetical protein